MAKIAGVFINSLNMDEIRVETYSTKKQIQIKKIDKKFPEIDYYY